jgi:hypothetical protein
VSSGIIKFHQKPFNTSSALSALLSHKHENHLRWRMLVDKTKEEYLAPESVASDYPGMTRRWLGRRRWERNGPDYCKVGKRILYRRRDIERFLSQSTVGQG